eukprot:6727627-Alexandrium_andersonii.AAC.1
MKRPAAAARKGGAGSAAAQKKPVPRRAASRGRSRVAKRPATRKKASARSGTMSFGQVSRQVLTLRATNEFNGYCSFISPDGGEFTLRDDHCVTTGVKWPAKGRGDAMPRFEVTFRIDDEDFDECFSIGTIEQIAFVKWVSTGEWARLRAMNPAVHDSDSD